MRTAECRAHLMGCGLGMSQILSSRILRTWQQAEIYEDLRDGPNGRINRHYNSGAGRAGDCSQQFSAEQHQVYASLSAANQHILSTQIKDKSGQPASCDFQRGLLDILANYTPDKRDADFKQLLDKMLIHTP